MMDEPRMQPFALWSLAPAAVREHMFDLTWDPADLFALPLPTEGVVVSSLLWHLDLPCWRDGERYFAVTPADVARDRLSHARQWRRTMDADLTCPIHLVDGPRRETILDGLHRLLKAHTLGIEQLPCRRLTSEMLRRIAKRRQYRERSKRPAHTHEQRSTSARDKRIRNAREKRAVG
jgi:hypothetical protein